MPKNKHKMTKEKLKKVLTRYEEHPKPAPKKKKKKEDWVAKLKRKVMDYFGKKKDLTTDRTRAVEKYYKTTKALSKAEVKRMRGK